MSQLVKNAARSALMAPLAAADTSLTVDITRADLFPAANTGTDPVNTAGKDWFKVVLEDINHNIEIVYVRTRTLGSAVMSNILRGQEGTTAISFASGSTIVGLRMTAKDVEDALGLAAQATTPGKDLLWAATVDAQVQKLGSALQKQLVIAYTTAGTSTAYTITPTPAVSAYAANLSFDITFNQACGAAPTLAISGLATPPNLVKQTADGTFVNVSAADIPANFRSRVTLISPTQALVDRISNVLSASTAVTQSANDNSTKIATTAYVDAAAAAVVTPGALQMFAMNSAPTGWLKANGAAVSRTTYANLFSALMKQAVATISIATPGVVTWNGHGLFANDPVKFTTTGALPTGLTAGTTYYVVGASITTNTFQVSATAGGAAIATSGTQSGVHKGINSPWGDGDGSTTFNVPDMRGNFPRGWDDSAGVDANRTFGSLQLDAMQGHTHGFSTWQNAGFNAFTATPSNSTGSNPSNNVGGPISDGTNGTPRTAAETRPRNVAGLWCIKY